ncbi:putative acetyltransferase YhhY [Candidatus Rubidus massiliensis]|nr:MAG: GNAT family N-acetyltransferase [Chlamydia sp. 32-24]CDZ79578.1 putative acetyltransferase YhhY [Candidatus Rubidus massiliensis]
MEEEKLDLPEGIDIRYTEVGDAKYLKQWLMDPTVSRWFPMDDEAEIDDAVNRWIGFYRYKCSLTAVKDGIPVGLSTLYLQPYKKLAHQCEFGIIVAPDQRNKKIGTFLINNIMHLARDTFKIELLHLQVYAENPAIRLYKRMGFTQFGEQTKWLKGRDGVHQARSFMEKELI